MMKESDLPETIPCDLWVCVPSCDDRVIAVSSDMSEYGYAVLGKVTVDVPVPKTDPASAMVVSLEKKAEKLEADHHVAMKQINDKIQSLLALEHDK